MIMTQLNNFLGELAKLLNQGTEEIAKVESQAALRSTNSSTREISAQGSLRLQVRVAANGVNFLVIGRSGERKTAADRVFSRSAREWEQEQREAGGNPELRGASHRIVLS